MIAVPVPDVLLEAGCRLLADRKKNDHGTSDPIFVVQIERRVYRIESGEEEGHVWVRIDGGDLVGEVAATRLDRRLERGLEIPEGVERVGYRVVWVFVDAYLSAEAAKERVAYENRKHCGTFRTYVESGCRNKEWKAMQTYLMALAEAEGKS